VTRIAWLSPLPPRATGIAEYAAALLPRIAARREVVVYHDPRQVPDLAGRGVERRSADAFRGDESLALYHVGADWSSMAFLWQALRRHPGLVVLHDWSLYDLVGGAFRGKGLRFAMEFARWEGREGIAELTRGSRGKRLWTPMEWNRAIRMSEDRRRRFPLNRRILKTARGVIVHSRWAARAVKDASPDTRVFIVPHGATPTMTGESPAEARESLNLAALGISPESFVVAMYGSFAEHKRVVPALRGIRMFARKHKERDVQVLMIGRPVPGFDLIGAVNALDLGQRVHTVERRLPLLDVHRLLRASNAYVGLRDPGLGATSGALVTALSVGTPTIVSDVAPFDELPASRRVPVGDGEEEALARALDDLAAAPEDAARDGYAAAMWMQERCSWERAADEYIDAIDTLADREPVF